MSLSTLVDPAVIAQLDAEERDFEVIDGEIHELMSAAAKHNRIGSSLIVFLSEPVDKLDWGRIVYETDFLLADDQRLRPDLALLSHATWNASDPSRVPMRAVPEIAIEIVSPSDNAGRLRRKIAIYRGSGVREVWVLFPDIPAMEIYSSAGVRELGPQDRIETPLLPGWSLGLGELIARV
jgi:Uma2 family endonuclease